MSDLIKFLLARVAEDEAWADDADRYGEHVNTDQIRRMCDAFRELVDDFNVLDADCKVSHLETAEGRRFQALVAMSRAASIWSDHPDYRDEWRP